tara:strand:+ start:97344 stop:98399 length:1056 start_codon:yes stop_codon:yes gene_type:complete
VKSFTPYVLASETVKYGLEVQQLENLIIKNLSYGTLKDKIFKLGFIPSELKRFLLNSQIGLVHSHFGQNGFASLKLAKFLDVPHVTTFHGLDITLDNVNKNQHGILLHKMHKNMGLLQENGNLFIAVSDFIKHKLIHKGFPENKIITNYIGIDTDYFSVKNGTVRENNIICVARHVTYKGINYLISAMEIINKHYPDWKLILIGDGPISNELKMQAKRASINVIFKGRLNSEEVKNELEKAKIYCQPSTKLENGHEEALALTIVEAQAMHLPAVVFDSGGMPEAIIPNKSGLVAAADDCEDLAAKIQSLISDFHLWNEFSQNARENAVKNHCFDKQIHKLEIIYKNLVKDK